MAGDRLLRIADVKEKVGLGTSTIYRKISAGEFPLPVDIGGGKVRWRESAIDAWIDALPTRTGVDAASAPAPRLRAVPS